MKKRYPVLNEQVRIYKTEKIIRERARLIIGLKTVLQVKFMAPFSIWETRAGQPVMCMPPPFFLVEELTAAPILADCEPARLSRAMQNPRYVPYFPITFAGKKMYVDLRQCRQIPKNHLIKYIGIPVDNLPDIRILEFMGRRFQTINFRSELYNL